MLDRLRRFRKLWKLSGEVESEKEKLLEAELLTGHAVILPDMTNEEMLKHEREEVQGWGEFFKLLK